MLIDVHGHIGCILPDRREFIDEFQDKLMFGIDSCKCSDVDHVWPTVATIRDLRSSRKLSAEALEKIEWRNSTRLLRLAHGDNALKMQQHNERDKTMTITNKDLTRSGTEARLALLDGPSALRRPCVRRISAHGSPIQPIRRKT